MSAGVGAPKTIDLAAEPDFRLGALLVRPSASRVADAQGEVRVEPRVMEVLIVLHRARGGTVTREQLIEACWGGRAISDDAITRVIAKVRQIANGSDEPPHFLIETLPKVGYRLSDGPDRDETIAATAPSTLVEGFATRHHGTGAQDIFQYPSRMLAARTRRNWFRELKASRLAPYAAGSILALLLVALVFQWIGGPANLGNRAEAARLTQAAHALLHEHNRASVAQAEHLLREAVAADPSYALAWARLGYATWFPWWWVEQKEPGAKAGLKAEALAYIRRALAISPDLAEAQGIMGVVLYDTNEGLPWLESAVRLDANDPDLWMWLGEARRGQSHDLRGALDAFVRARALDPSWHTLDAPYLELVFRVRGPAEAYRELDRMAKSLNDQNWPLQMRADLEFTEGRFADSAAAAITALRAHPQNPYWALNRLMFIGALLGDKDLVTRALKAEPILHANYDPFNRPGWAYARAQASPETWWDGTVMGPQAVQLISEGKSRLLVALYDRRFAKPAAFVMNCPCNPIAVGPELVVALRQSKRQRDANEILAGVSRIIGNLEAAGDQWLQTKVGRARIAALAGDFRTAKQRLREAVERGWKGQDVCIDPAIDPAFASLQDDAEFQAIVTALRAAQRTETENLARTDMSGI